ncbi:hypothetical protein MASR1M107_05420 [Ignavibacteriales bacterium]
MTLGEALHNIATYQYYKEDLDAMNVVINADKNNLHELVEESIVHLKNINTEGVNRLIECLQDILDGEQK